MYDYLMINFTFAYQIKPDVYFLSGKSTYKIKEILTTFILQNNLDTVILLTHHSYEVSLKSIKRLLDKPKLDFQAILSHFLRTHGCAQVSLK